MRPEKEQLSGESSQASNSWRHRYTDSSSFRTALVFTVLIGVSAGVLSYFTNQFNTSTLITGVNLGISGDIASFNDWQEMAPVLTVPEIIDRLRKNHIRSFFSYQNADGEYVYGAMNLDGVDFMPLGNKISLVRLSPDRIRAASEFDETRRFAVRHYELKDGSKLIVGRDIEQMLVERQRMQQLGLLSIVLMLVVIASSFYISNYISGLTNNISETAQKIMSTGDFSKRISVDEKNSDDLSNLASILNTLLARADHLMQSVRQVSDNIAHDLRTPLTRLRNQLDDLETRVKKLGDEESQQIAESVIREADHILGTFSALLRIARIESGKREKDFSSVELQPLLEDILELYQPLAEEKGIDVVANIQPLMTWGDADMLFQVFANLMDNAVKFTPDKGKIDVSCRSQDAQIIVEFADSGVGISDEEKSKVFDRFYRAEQSRTKAGNGLGLSLAGAVMTLHEAKIEIRDNHPGSRFVIELKKRDVIS